MNLSRRHLMLLAGGAAVAPLVGCASVNSQVPSWVAALEAIATEAGSILPQLEAAGLSGADAAKAQQIVAEIQSALKVINIASSETQGQSALATVEGYINALAPLALPFVSLIPGGTVVGLIVAALPAIELALNFIVSLLTPQAKELAASAPKLPAKARFKGRLRGRYAVTQTQIAQQYLILLEARAAKSRYRLRFRRHHRQR